jgi:DeoR/GlpR family transcriptional regulator of sugar metabolism
MFRNEREDEIIRILSDSNYMTVENLARKLFISPSSIRRDLTDLEKRGVVNRSYGGVQLANSINRIVSFDMRSHENLNEKKKIARKAASLVKSGDVIYLDGSSSTYLMVSALALIRNITVVTNSIESVYNLAQYNIKTICTGGTVSTENRAVLVDNFAENTIRTIHADYVFFSAQAVLDNGDIYDCYESEVFLRRLMIRNAAKSVFLADRSKFSNSSVYFMENIKNIDCVISDIELNDDFRGQFRNVEFLVV